MLLFHGVYARMYSLFLLCSALSYFALLVVLQRGGAARWVLWGLSAIATVAVHPYGALVLASQGLYVLVARARVREAVAAFAVVALVGAPFWYADLVLASRFDVGVGGGGAKLSGPIDVLDYLFRTAETSPRATCSRFSRPLPSASSAFAGSGSTTRTRPGSPASSSPSRPPRSSPHASGTRPHRSPGT
jgi:hypothetical protein